MKPETIRINEVEHVRTKAASIETGEIRIVILQRGWVAVGYFSQEGTQCTLSRAAIIRVWGTTEGLGEIANGGPTNKTVLDRCPTLHFHELTVIATMDCEASKWCTVLS